MIPSRFQVMGRTVTVEMVDDLYDKHDCTGKWFENLSLIRLQSPNKDFSESVIAQSFWHEALHSILDSLWEHDMSKNEKLVEQISQCIYQVEMTRVFPPPPPD